MTSKKLFSNMLLITLRSRIWGIALSCIGFFFTLPIYCAIYASIITSRVADNIYYTPDVIMRLFRANVLGEKNIFTAILVFLLAVFFAVNGFMYIFSKSKTDMYHSLPVKRSLLFSTNYIAGVISFIVPYTIFLITAVIIGSCYGLVNGTSIKVALITYIINILGFLLEYTTAITILMLTGNLPVAITAIIVANAYLPAVNLLLKLYKEMFFKTYSFRSDETLWIYSSPVTFYNSLSHRLNSFTPAFSLDVIMALKLLLTIALMFLIAYMLYSKRATEGSGTTIAFTKLIPFISVLLLTVLGLYTAYLFGEITDCTQKSSYGWFIFGMIISIIIGHFILQAIYYQDFKSLLKKLHYPVISLVFAAIISIIFINDLTGYDHYVPGEDIDYCTIFSYSLCRNQNYYDFDADVQEWGYIDYTVSNDTYVHDHMKITDRNVYAPFIEAAAEETRNINHNEEIALYNEDNEDTYCFLDVCFTKKNGSKVYRSYQVRFNNVLDTFAPVYASKEYKDGIYSILTADNDKLKSNLYYADSLGKTALNNDSISDADRQLLIDTYRREFTAQDVYDIADNAPIGYLCSITEKTENGITNSYYEHLGYVYPSFKETISLLEAQNIDLYRSYDISNIEYIKVTNYNAPQESVTKANTAYDSIDASVTSAVFDKREDIEKIMACTVPYDFYDVNYDFHMPSKLDCEVKYKSSPDPYTTSVQLAFFNNQIPDFVSEAVSYQ